MANDRIVIVGEGQRIGSETITEIILPPVLLNVAAALTAWLKANTPASGSSDPGHV